ncbi:hypothetical protein MNBD_ACTINO02-2196 [hydrothermal vent metagenome]|uniref:Uncharacterized protein n=1 Tax=hydrothermal vent metagenome TaxID=652676 RepID=A0A3B0SY25_9ZZZZ
MAHGEATGPKHQETTTEEPTEAEEHTQHQAVALWFPQAARLVLVEQDGVTHVDRLAESAPSQAVTLRVPSRP